MTGAPVLLCRKGRQRADLESPLADHRAVSLLWRHPPLCANRPAARLLRVCAAEQAGLPWNLANLLTARLPGISFVSGDAALAMAQAKKSEWELDKIAACAGRATPRGLWSQCPARLHPGMTEREISIAVLGRLFCDLGHQGQLRMGGYGEEIFLGHIAAGDSANYPSVFNGPVGLRGEHPALPFSGYAGTVWKKGQVLTIDNGFALEGYSTDKTQVYFAGKASSHAGRPPARATTCAWRVQQAVAERLRPGAIPASCTPWP
ncbi:MAG: M24 family metallopeptidase [Solidesulfovibrio sp.]